jgi:colanic acid/amylovoran biosynthesis protein
VNVLIVNGYSARNRGDGMIVNQMIRLFEERGAAVRLMSDDPDDDFRDTVRWVPPLVHTWPGDPSRPSRARMLGQIARRWLWPAAGHESFRWADLCVSAGGGYLYDDGTSASRLNLVLRLLPLRAARRAGLGTVLFSQSIGPFASPRWRRLVGRELRRATLVIARERLSFGVCRELGVERLELCDDVAFVLRPSAQPAAGAASEAPASVGVTVMNSLPGVDEAGYRSYRQALRDGVVEALRGREERVVVVSQVAVHGKDSDIEAATELAEELRAAGVEASFADLGEHSDPALSAFYGQFELVIASRLHSGILALCSGTPIVALSYLPKTDGVLERLGMSSLVHPAAGLEPHALAATVRDALEHRDELRALVAERLVEARQSAERAADLSLAAARMDSPEGRASDAPHDHDY